MADDARRGRSGRTLAWLGDAAFEREVRWRVASRGDYPTDRLDAIKAEIVRAEAQAALLAAVEGELTQEEASVARRGRNADPGGRAGRRATQAYRAATAFEALVAHWALGGAQAWQRFLAVVGPPLEAWIDEAVAKHATKPRRG